MIGAKVFTEQEARAFDCERDVDDEAYYAGLVFWGWLWRCPANNVNAWHYISSWSSGRERYLTNARFIPVFTFKPIS